MADDLKKKMKDLICSAQEEGILSKSFDVINKLKADNPTFAMDLIPVFCSDAEAVIRKMHRTLDQPTVDFDEMEELRVKIKGSCLCIGAIQLTHTCYNLRWAIDERSREGCRLILEAIKRDYYALHGRLNQILKMEMRILGQEKEESSARGNRV